MLREVTNSKNDRNRDRIMEFNNNRINDDNKNIRLHQISQDVKI